MYDEVYEEAYWRIFDANNSKNAAANNVTIRQWFAMRNARLISIMQSLP